MYVVENRAVGRINYVYARISENEIMRVVKNRKNQQKFKKIHTFLTKS